MRSPLLLVVTIAMIALPAAAELADRDKEIVIGGDHALAEEAKNTITFEGKVVITQGTMRMTANKVAVREDKDRHHYFVAHGSPVTFRQKRDNVDEWVEGFAGRAEYDERNDFLQLFDRARVKRNNDELTGDYISYDMKKKVVEVAGAPVGAKSPNAGRVKGVIVPPRKAPEGEKPSEPMTLKPDTGS